jgi:hypothetical protein
LLYPFVIFLLPWMWHLYDLLASLCAYSVVFSVQPCLLFLFVIFLLPCRWHLYDLLANRNAWWAPGKTLELRRRLKPYCEVNSSTQVACGASAADAAVVVLVVVGTATARGLRLRRSSYNT